MTIADKLVSINNTKQAIKTAIEAKGVAVGSVSFATYPSLIDSIPAGGSSGSEWTRPTDWLALPTVSPTEQKFVGLFPVFNNNSNGVSLSCRGGAYTVNWGDGFVQNVAAGGVANYNYSYAAISNATLTSRGYKQVIITVTPQVGQTITQFNINRDYFSSTFRTSLWLDITMSFPSADIVTNDGSMYHPLLERFVILSSSQTSLANFCRNMYSLRVVQLPGSNTVTNMSNMFQDCSSLVEIPSIGLSAITNATNAFRYCYALERILIQFTTSLTAATNMFAECYALKESPSTLNTSALLDFSNMFDMCYSLEYIPVLNTSSATNLTKLFKDCRSIKTIPSLNTVNVTNMNSMFCRCRALEEIPWMNTSNVTTMNEYSLGFCRSCYSLRKFPAIDTSKLTVVDGMFYECFSLTELPELNFTAVITLDNNSFSSCFSVGRFRITNIKQTVNLNYMRLNAAELNEVYTNLATVTSKTIYVTGNPGVAGDDPSIATAKGWTVVG